MLKFEHKQALVDNVEKKILLLWTKYSEIGMLSKYVQKNLNAVNLLIKFSLAVRLYNWTWYMVPTIYRFRFYLFYLSLVFCGAICHIPVAFFTRIFQCLFVRVFMIYRKMKLNLMMSTIFMNWSNC